MEETLVTFETAKLAKEKGFNIDCLNYYILKYNKTPYIEQGIEYQSDRYIEFDWNLNKESSKQIKAPYPNTYHESQCSAPTQSLLQKWLREKHNIVVEPTLLGGLVSETNLFDCSVFYVKNKTICESKLKVTNSYEEVLEIGLIEALKLI